MRDWLNRISPESRERIIFLEAELRRCDEQIDMIDRLIEIQEMGECLLSLEKE